MNLKQTFLLSGVVLIGALMLLNSNNIDHPVLADSVKVQNSTTEKLETKIDAKGAVTVTVTPLGISSKVSEWKFDVGLSTHSIELDQDMTQVSVLVDDRGNEYKPTRWEGAGPGGHHREGLLVFKPISPIPKSVELQIVGIDAPVRSFVWNITN